MLLTLLTVLLDSAIEQQVDKIGEKVILGKSSVLQLPREHNKQAKAPPNSPRRIDSRNTRSLKRVGNNLEAAHWTISSNVEIEVSG